ncbi:14556_t:CDS:1, partial [Cetraspora pellucida]
NQETTELSSVISDNKINISTSNSLLAKLSEFLETSNEDIVDKETKY